MAISNFIAKLWAAAVQMPFNKNLVYTQDSVANRKYEGMIKQMGDTVNITTITDPTIKSYDKTQDIVVDEVSDNNLKLTIDQGDYYAFGVNDVDELQAAGDFEGPELTRAGILLRDKADRYAAALLRDGALAANQYGAATVNVSKSPTSGQIGAYDLLSALRERLDNQSVPDEGRYAVVSPRFHTSLLTDIRFSRVDASGSADGLRNGIVGRALGMDIMKSPNVPGAFSAPVGFALGTTATTGGTLAAGLTGWAVTAVSATGVESNASATLSATLTGSTSSQPLSWTAPTGAASYNVYRTTDGGASWKMVTTAGAQTTTAYTDAGGAGTTATPPNRDIIIAGVPDAYSFANQLVETEALRDQKRFRDIVRGLNIYGSKVTHPEGLATAAVSYAAGA